MANEKRLIDADEAKKKLRAVKEWFDGCPCTEQDRLAQAVVKMCIEEIDKIKPADAAEVIRCKDCFADGCCSVQIDLEMGGEGYCPKGKRRTDNGC